MIRHRRAHRFAALSPLAATITLATALALSASGCRSVPTPRVDLALARHSRTADEAFHAGYDERALGRYRLALRRAWEIDDARSIANTAFNLAACLAAMREYEPAREALAEARAESLRSGESQVDAWLLEAKIARVQGRLDEAAYLADCVLEPLIRTSPQCSAQPCGECVRRAVGSLGSALTGARRTFLQVCRHADGADDPCQSNLVSLSLFRANLMLDQADIERARVELDKAEQAIAERGKSRSGRGASEDPATRAELAATHARLLLLLNRPLEAARRLDEEARWLTTSEHYRELPTATVAAAEAFLMAELPLEAAERFFRAARLLYGRDDLLAALYFLERSIELAVELADVDLQLRGALLLGEIDRANPKRSSSSDPAAPAGDPIISEELPSPRQPPASTSAVGPR